MRIALINRLLYRGGLPLSANSKFQVRDCASQVRGVQSVTVPCRSNGSIQLRYNSITTSV